MVRDKIDDVYSHHLFRRLLGTEPFAHIRWFDGY